MTRAKSMCAAEAVLRRSVCSASAALLLCVLGCSGGANVDLGGTAGAPAQSLQPVASLNAMTIHLGGTQYDYSCSRGPSLSGVSWEGPRVQAHAGSPCEWPKINPGFDMAVRFTGFLPSQGFPPGTYELSALPKQNVLVTLYASDQAEVPVGQSQKYAAYSSMTTDSIDELPTAAAPGVSGTVTVVKYGPDHVVPGYRDPQPGEFPDFDVSLSHVVLPLVSNKGTNFPSTVTIDSAQLYNRWH